MKSLAVLSLINMRPRKVGTVEEYCLFLSRALAEKGWRSILGFIEAPPEWLHDMFRKVGAVVEVVSLNAPLPVRLRSIGNVIRKHKADIVHSTFLNIFSLDVAVMKCCGAKKIIFSDQVSRTPTQESAFRKSASRVKNRAICSWIDMIIADAEFIREELVEKSAVRPAKIKVIYNGVNLGRFCSCDDRAFIRKKMGVPLDCRVVTTVAKCIPEKGIDVFLRASSAVSRNMDKVMFVVVGDGPLLEELKALSASLGIFDKTLFMGLRSDVEEILAMSDVFVLCSMWQEAFAFTLLEAMACGLPVVASRIGAIPESILDGVTGFLFTAGDAAEAASAVEAILMSDTLRAEMGLAGRKRAESHFSMERWVNETIGIYERIL